MQISKKNIECRLQQIELGIHSSKSNNLLTCVWAPSIVEKKEKNSQYKYYYYFTANKKIGVAVADHPTGSFVDLGKPLIDKFPEGMNRGQNIDPDVFTDTKTGKSYLYWGNYFMAGQMIKYRTQQTLDFFFEI